MHRTHLRRTLPPALLVLAVGLGLFLLSRPLGPTSGVPDPARNTGSARRVDASPRASTLTGRPRPNQPSGEASPASEASPAATIRVVVVREEDERPIEGATVVFMDAEFAALLDRLTSADGVVETTAPLKGLRYVAATAEGRGRVRTWLGRRGEEPVERVIPLPPGVVLRGAVVDAMDDRPIAGARVELAIVAPPAMSKMASWRLEETWAWCVTGSDGTFSFEGCGRENPWIGNHCLLVSAPGYAHVEKAVTDVTALLDGTSRIALPRAGAIEGRVLRPDGSGAAGAEVLVVPVRAAWLIDHGGATRACEGYDGYAFPEDDFEDGLARPFADLWRLFRLEAGDNGQFHLDALPMGLPFRLEARSEADARSEPVVAEADAAAEPLVLRLRRPACVRVVARLADGRPVAGVEVRLERHASLDRKWSALEQHRAFTDTSGVARFEALTPGPTSARGFLPTANAWARAEAVLEEGANLEMALVYEMEEDVELPDPTASAVLRGRVVDDKGEGVAGVHVHTSPKGRAKTDAEGRFEVAGLPPGRVEVRVFHVPGHEAPWPAPFVEAPADDVEIVVVRHACVEGAVVVPLGDATPPRGHLSYYSESSQGGSGALKEAGPERFAFTMSCPGSVHHVELYLWDHLPVVWEVDAAPGATIRLPDRVLDRGFVLQGVVRDAAGRPLPGVRIHVDQDGQREGSQEFGRIERATTTAEDGSFAIPALRPGEALLRAAAPWLFQSRMQTVAVPEAGALLEIALPAEAVVTGRLQDGEGLPLAGRTVLLVDPEVEGLEKRVLTSVTTDVGGRFRLRAEAGRYRLEIHEGERDARRVATSTEVLDLAPNAPRDVILTVRR